MPDGSRERVDIPVCPWQKWTAVDYSIAAGAGKMLFSGPDTQAPPLYLNPGVSGWRHIFVGIYRNYIFPDYMLLPPNHIDYTGPGEFQKQHSEYRCVSPDGQQPAE